MSYNDKNLEVTSPNFHNLENDCSIQMSACLNREINELPNNLLSKLIVAMQISYR